MDYLGRAAVSYLRRDLRNGLVYSYSDFVACFIQFIIQPSLYWKISAIYGTLHATK